MENLISQFPNVQSMIVYFLTYVAIGIVLTYTLFISYVFAMGVKRVRDRGKLTKLNYSLSYPVVLIGYTVDVLVNQLYMSVICLDPFHFGTVTNRMQKYKYSKATNWQKAVSAWIELHIDDFEDTPNGHI